MDIALNNILKEHKHKYPKMELVDCLKIIYQQTFGPSHFNKEINQTMMRLYIENELKEFTYYSHTPIIENIGNGYCRISLEIIKLGDLSIDELNELFINSMARHQEMSDVLKQIFLKKIDGLIQIIENRELDFDIKITIAEIQEYVKTGIKPTHHSELYRKSYFPSYRVIHTDFVPKNLILKFIDQAN